MNVAVPSTPPSSACAIIACSAASCSCYCQTTYSKLMLCQLIVYGGGNSDMGGGVGGSNWLSESANHVLDLLSNSYSDSNVFLCKG